MANPLQPKCIKVLENEYKAYVIKIIKSSKAGDGDIVACIDGLFYMFEIKWKSDKPSELQKVKINRAIDAGGYAYFVRSVEELREFIEYEVPPIKYKLSNKLTL